MSKKCINCGFELENDQLLCPECGTKQHIDPQPITEAAEETKTPPVQANVGEASASAESEKATTSSKNKKKTFVIAGIALGVVVALLLGAVLILKPSWLGFNSNNDDPSDPSDQETTDPGQSPSNPDAKTEYTVSIKTIGGRPISKHTFYIYEGDDLKAYGQTDANGIGKVSLKRSNNYTIELTKSDLEGYDVADRYNFTGNSAVITLTSHIIADTNLAGVQYQLGDIIHDFTVTTTDGSTFTLSEVLKTKKAVMINFWYSTCSPCINEFPYMQAAYENYKDDIEIIALNNYATDTENTVKNFKADMGLTFPVAKDYSRLGSAFSLTGYPTSIVIDRYGTICLIEVGGLTSEKPFTAVFEHFSADDYKQQLIQSIDELTPLEIPNVEMPSSEEIGAVLNGQNFTATYTPETESSDAEYSWPFIIGAKDGVNCIVTSNAEKDRSYATLHATVNLKAGEALAVDWFAETERGADTLFILVDGKDIYQISGISESWATCYPFVALEDGTHKVTFVYVKDSSTDAGEDCVYLKNMRTVAIREISTPTYIPRQAATKPNANGLGFNHYITPVFNEKDGYYHVGTADGPILLVNLMAGTQLSGTSLNDHGYNGDLIVGDNDEDLYEILVTYCNYAINGTMYGYSPVTEELKMILEKAAEKLGNETQNPNQWLQACSYYDAYGTDGKQLEDPVKGVAFFAAYDTVLSTDTEEKFNTVVYDGRVIMPRGLKFKFVPTQSGVYLIRSQEDGEKNGWVFNDKYEIIYTAEVVERPYQALSDSKYEVDTTNVSMLLYLEAGETYYIDIAYYDVYAEGSFTFTVKYVAETYTQFHLASPGYFTYVESTTGQINQTIAGGIDVALGEDGYYHEVLADGSLGSLVYADFNLPTGMFSHSILNMIEMDGFDMRYNETDLIVLAKLEELNGDKDACLAYYQKLWGDEYAEWEDIYKLEEVLAGTYHGPGEDLTDDIQAYVSKMITNSAPELEGCVLVDEDLAELLQALMDKYTFSGVKNSWTKLCYYYKNLAS